jgi:hypothetical protein
MINISCKGNYRTVILFKDFVIKIPVLTSMQNFLYGCYCNWSERQFYKNAETLYLINNKYLLCPSYFCFIFGLFEIQKKAEELKEELTQEQIKRFTGITHDFKKENFGYINNNLVCLDYP